MVMYIHSNKNLAFFIHIGMQYQDAESHSGEKTILTQRHTSFTRLTGMKYSLTAIRLKAQVRVNKIRQKKKVQCNFHTRRYL